MSATIALDTDGLEMLMLFRRATAEGQRLRRRVLEPWQTSIVCGDTVCIPNWETGRMIIAGVYGGKELTGSPDHLLCVVYTNGHKSQVIKVWRGHVLLAVSLSIEELRDVTVEEAAHPYNGWERLVRQVIFENRGRYREDLSNIAANLVVSKLALEDPALLDSIRHLPASTLDMAFTLPAESTVWN